MTPNAHTHVHVHVQCICVRVHAFNQLWSVCVICNDDNIHNVPCLTTYMYEKKMVK